MNKKELKGLIKEVVKETMAEMMLELNFSNIIESALSKDTNHQQSARSQLNEAPRQQLQQTSQKPKTDLRKKLGISEQEWQNVYADIAEGDSPILSEASNPVDSQPKPPEVSVNDLAEAGLYRDYSKFL
jgi:hypothetical protein